MAMDDTLFKAILAMDSYNRGYNAGIKFGTQANNADSAVIGVTKIGNAVIYDTAGDASAEATGFYGIAYQYNNQVTIAYRGTDQFISPIAKDVVYGYGIGGGATDVAQAKQAFEFYKAVSDLRAGRTGSDPFAANISVTGHSMGGGLAGLVGAAYGKSGILFDNMAFESAADRLAFDRDYYLDVNKNTTSYAAAYASGIVRTTASMLDAVYGTGTVYKDPNYSRLKSIDVAGEPLSNPFIPGDHAHQTRTSIETLDMGDVGNLTGTLQNFFLGTAHHNVATLVLLEYAKVTSGVGTDWKAASQYFWPVLYDGDFADKINMDSIPGRYNTEPEKGAHDYAAILRNLLAYSAISEGTRIFGDTGIRSLYNDANDLGRAVSSGVSGAPSTLSLYGTDISKAFVEFAGDLALNKVLEKSSAGPDPVLSGVLSVADVTGNHTLSVDFSDTAWKRANNGAVPDIVSRTDMLNHIIAENPDIAGMSGRASFIAELKAGEASSGAYDRVMFNLSEGGETQISEKSIASERMTLFVGGLGADIITGSSKNDFIIGGQGADTFKASGGWDILMGGLGTDTVSYAALAQGIIVSSESMTGTDDIRLVVGKAPQQTDFVYGVENIIGTSYDDIFRIGNSPSTDYKIDGGGGNDRLEYGLSRVIDDRTGTVTGLDGHVDTYQNIERVSGSGDHTVVMKDGGVYEDKFGDVIYNYVSGNVVINGTGSFSPDDYAGTGLSGAYAHILNFGSIEQNQVQFVRNGNSGIYTVAGRGTITVKDFSIKSYIVDPELPTTIYTSDQPYISSKQLNLNVHFNAPGTVQGWYGNDTYFLDYAAYGTPGAPLFYINDIGGADKIVLGSMFDADKITLLARNDNHEMILQYDGRNLARIAYATVDDLIETFQFSNGITKTFDNMVIRFDGSDNDDTFSNVSGESTHLSFRYSENDLRLYGGLGNDKLTGGRGDDVIYGGAGNDTLAGDYGSDTLYGDAGNDILDGGFGGTDRLYGGDGDDTLYYRNKNTNDVLDGGNGYDTAYITVPVAIDAVNHVLIGRDFQISYNSIENLVVQQLVALGGSQDTVFSYTSSSASVFRDSGGVDAINIVNDTGFENIAFSKDGQDLFIYDGVNMILWDQLGTDASRKIEYMTLENGAFSLDLLKYNTWLRAAGTFDGDQGNATGVNKADTILGSSNADTIHGWDLADRIYAGAGDDTVYGDADNDFLHGGDGNDRVYGGAGNDAIWGGKGNDTIIGDAGDDMLYGGAGTDTLSYAGAASAVTVSLALTTAQATGGAGKDTVSGFEKLTGSSWNDTLTGSAGNDTIAGGAGNDTINGGNGNDILYGDAGADILTGGAGNDRFMFDRALSGVDTIRDFNKAQDILDVSNLLTAFDPLTDAITKFVQITNSGANSIVKVDLDGAGTAHGWTQVATLTGVTGLTDEQALVNSGHLIA